MQWGSGRRTAGVYRRPRSYFGAAGHAVEGRHGRERLLAAGSLPQRRRLRMPYQQLRSRLIRCSHSLRRRREQSVPRLAYKVSTSLHAPVVLSQRLLQLHSHPHPLRKVRRPQESHQSHFITRHYYTVADVKAAIGVRRDGFA